MSTINVSNITDGTTTVGTSYVVNGSAKAWSWHSHDGTDYNSFNVSSVTDVSTGLTRLAWTNSFSSISYACTGAHDDGTGNDESRMAGFHSKSSTVVTEYIYTSSGSVSDQPRSGVFHGDLA